MKKNKYYTVWKGRQPGIYNSWQECQEQTKGFPDAKFKAFLTRQLAEQAFNSKSDDFIGKDIFESQLTKEQLILIGDPILESIAVDAAWDTSSGRVEWQGVHTKTRKVLFHQGPFEDGTINIVEFLAIVHGLGYCKQEKLALPIYSDSRNALGWVKDKVVRTNHGRSEANKPLFNLVDRALKWLKENEYSNPLLKWETKAWGENPADFGRK